MANETDGTPISNALARHGASPPKATCSAEDIRLWKNLSTIGFGDFVPGSDLLEQGATSGSGQAKLIICCFYLVLGLAIIAMAFSLVQEEVVLKCKDLANALRALVSTDDGAASSSTAGADS